MACRVATSTEDVWYDGESFDVTAVQGVLTVVSLRCVPLQRVKRSVATTDSLDAAWLVQYESTTTPGSGGTRLLVKRRR